MKRKYSKKTEKQVRDMSCETPLPTLEKIVAKAKKELGLK